jgi:hypothetical protein
MSDSNKKEDVEKIPSIESLQHSSTDLSLEERIYFDSLLFHGELIIKHIQKLTELDSVF